MLIEALIALLLVAAAASGALTIGLATIVLGDAAARHDEAARHLTQAAAALYRAPCGAPPADDGPIESRRHVRTMRVIDGSLREVHLTDRWQRLGFGSRDSLTWRGVTATRCE